MPPPSRKSKLLENMMLTRAPSVRSKPADVSSSAWQIDFGQPESVGGVGGDSSIGLSDDIEANQSTTESAGVPKRRDFSRPNVTSYEDDSVMLWSEDPEKEYFEYMLQQEQETRARKGKSSEDSLIGQSTVAEIQRSSQWHQNGGQDSCEIGDDGNLTLDTRNSFPILSTFNKVGGGSSFGGSRYSLATAEKSKQHSDDDNNPDGGHDKRSNRCIGEPTVPTMFPNYIYVGDGSSVLPPSVDKNSTNRFLGTREAPRGRCFYIMVFFLGGLCLAGAAVAVYLSVTTNDTGGSNGGNSSAAASSQAYIIRISGPPSSQPSATWLSQQDDETSRPAISPFSTPAPSPPGTYALTELPLTQNPTTQPLLTNVAEVVPTPVPTGKPSTPVPTGKPSMEPTRNPTPAPSVKEQPPTPAPSASTTLTSTTLRCGCTSCSSVWTMVAGGYTCGERISFLVSERAYSEIGACRLVGGIEFPGACGLCDPENCATMNMAISANESEPSVVPLPNTPGPSPMPATASPTSFRLKVIGNDGIPTDAFPLGRCEG
jgi:hypothetical protein